MSRWINLLALLPNTSLTLLIISIAFFRFYDETDFFLLGQLASPRLWSNRLTVAALLGAVVNLGVEWNRRNRETDRLAQAEQRKAKETERAARRTRIEVERDLALLNFLADPSEQNRHILAQAIAVLSEYRDSL
ncbi:hypothetical protein GS597_02420 [Synechococcales cyanobacterium C]|uniref:Uncharacterized protein n=1 Tax=Petrachloros mirabilis ULC683 TaxID=2781853 RepID=A0A8K1ZWG5_9CYAN|nr:hypothetical protein [Petrachloros mirabilis]NCJ05386.1 hypothetical protein [Petrachloros mirabilis ULC683]